MLRVAIVGLGRWGQVINTRLKKSTKIVATHGVDPACRTLESAEGLSNLSLSDDFDAVVASDQIDAVILATPHMLHEAQATAALAAGKHVFCEKPLTLTAESARRIAARARAEGLALGVGHERRFETLLVELRQMVTSGELGKIVHIDCNWSHNGVTKLANDNWRKDPRQAPCGMFTGLGIHITDWVQSVFGPFQTVDARTEEVSGPGGDSVSLSVRYSLADGVDGWLCCLGATPFYFRLVVFGDAGWAEVRQSVNVEFAETATIEICKGEAHEFREVPMNDAVLKNLEAWADAAAGDAPYPISDAELIHNISVMEAIVDSSFDKAPKPVT